MAVGPLAARVRALSPSRLISGSTAPMQLTDAQKAAIRADIQADPALAPIVAAGNDIAVANAYNVPAVPAFYVYKTNMPLSEVLEAVTWTELIARSQGERDTLDFMLKTGSINPSSANVRQGFADIFSGGTGVNSRNALITAFRRPATRLERLFATGTGTTAAPGTIVVTGTLTSDDVSSILHP